MPSLRLAKERAFAKKRRKVVRDAVRKHTDCCRFNHVTDGESLDRLILGRTSRTV